MSYVETTYIVEEIAPVCFGLARRHVFDEVRVNGDLIAKRPRLSRWALGRTASRRTLGKTSVLRNGHVTIGGLGGGE